MSKSRALVCLLCIAAFSIGSFAVTADRVTVPLSGGPTVALKGNVHGLARPENDLGRADSSRLVQGVTLAFHPSAAQQKDLDDFLRQLGDPSSPNYHKYLTPKQFGARFGLSQSDIDKVTTWLQSQGFTNIKVAHSRNEISFDGTIAQIESVFQLEMHNYAVNGEVHLANAGEPRVPAGLATSILNVGHLHDFAPRPRAKVQPHLTSYLSGNHFLTPGDFATIYDLQPLYSAGIDGTGQKIAVIGQSTVSATDLNNFRTVAGLPASTVTMTLQGGTGTRCAGDEGESDLDLEWAGGVAKGATIIFVYAGLKTGDTCSARANSVWDALDYAVQNNVAPFISSSYGYCESGLGATFAKQVQTWAQQGQSQGQTIVASSGDAGPADCESGTSTSATTGYAVDIPAAIPEVTGAGGSEFTGDAAACPSTGCSNNTAPADPPYWSGSGSGSDTVSSALEYIPETAWNDTTFDIANGGGLSASGGGASAFASGFFVKPSWQTGTGVPSDGARDVPDISLTASADHDGYLVCTEDGSNGTTSCSSGFRNAAGGTFDIVGGTSAAAPTFSAILALFNQYFGAASGSGLAPINPTLYSLAASHPSAFHDITSGDNKVPCTAGSTNCPTGTTEIGFAAGPGYDQVTGLGSVDGYVLAQAWYATVPSFTLTAGALNPASVAAGVSATTTVTITPQNGFTDTVNLSCSGVPSGVSCSWNPTSLAGGGGTSQLTVQTQPNMAAASTTVVLSGSSTSRQRNSSVPMTVTATTETFSLASNLGSNATLSVTQGQTSSALNLTVSSTSTPPFVANSLTNLSLTYSCTGLPSESTCTFVPNQTRAISVSLTIATTAPTGRLENPLTRGTGVFYAVLFPGLLGIAVTVGGRKRSLSVVRMLALTALLGLSVLWMTSCGGSSSSNKNPGTPTGNYPITVNATTGGASPIQSSYKLTLSVQ
jgi:subtilase family serine protease